MGCLVQVCFPFWGDPPSLPHPPIGISSRIKSNQTKHLNWEAFWSFCDGLMNKIKRTEKGCLSRYSHYVGNLHKFRWGAKKFFSSRKWEIDSNSSDCIEISILYIEMNDHCRNIGLKMVIAESHKNNQFKKQGFHGWMFLSLQPHSLWGTVPPSLITHGFSATAVKVVRCIGSAYWNKPKKPINSLWPSQKFWSFYHTFKKKKIREKTQLDYH